MGMETTDIEVGAKFLFHGRMIYLGEVTRVTLFDVYIKNACWMEDMGIRMSELLAKGIVPDTTIEIAPQGHEIAIPRGGFARFPWAHELPKKSQ